MTRRNEPGRENIELLKQILNTGPDSLGKEDKQRLIQELRQRNPELAAQIDALLLDQIHRLNSGLASARQSQSELAELLKTLTAPPSFPATFLRCHSTADGTWALVAHNGQYRLLGFADGVDPQSLRAGEQVLLNHELNLIVGCLPDFSPACGETAVFERLLPDGRLIVAVRDEQLVVQPASCLALEELTPGDMVRWDKQTWLAHERLAPADNQQFFLEDVPTVSPHRIGGQSANVRQLIEGLTSTLVDPDKAAAYGVNDGRNSILMVGPPGCGKTLMARVAVSELSRISGRRCRFAVVNAADWEDPYVGVTQRNIRKLFQTLRAAAGNGDLVVVFIDEVEAVGRVRGSHFNQHGDKFLAALLCALDGFTDRAGVAIIAATNRKDLLDPALLERLSEVEIQVPRPDMQAARAIFEVHLSDRFPFSPNGDAASRTRDHVLDLAVSRLYAPNAPNEVCTLRFRDGKTRTVAARELMSGRAIEQICRAARRTAFLRDVQHGQPGITALDMEESVTAAIVKMSTTLTRRNAHAYLADLPQDIDVVTVDPIQRRVTRPHRYLNIN